MMPYEEFLRKKFAIAPQAGIPCTPDEVSPILKPHQRRVVAWAVQGGRRAIFLQFGMGKTYVQLEIMRILHERVGGKFLIVCPLGVRQEFHTHAATLGQSWQFVRRTDEMTEQQDLYLTNFESIREGKLDPNLFTGASLDEAAVLRSYGSKTFQEFLRLFPAVPYRYVATATPSPNRIKELIHYAGFLGILDTSQALTRFFKRDSTKANNLTLYPHMEQQFWYWCSSWAVFAHSPAELCECGCHTEKESLYAMPAL